MKIIFVLPMIFLVLIGCKNPFAPAFDENPSGSSTLIADQKTIDGVFQNFYYAYSVKDTIIYSNLLTSDFIFTYRDYDQGFDVSWGLEEEMKTTYGLFQNTQRLDLIWNNIILSSEDSLNAEIVRSFNLTIIFNPTDVVRVDGKVRLSLRKDADTEVWRISRWIDESNF